MGFPLYVTSCFSLDGFNILSVCLIFVSLINMCHAMFLLGFILYRILLFLDLIVEIFNYNLLNFFLIFFFLFFPTGNPIIQILVHSILSQWSLRLSSVLFILFTLFCSSEVISTIIFQLTDSFFYFRYSAIDSFQVFLISVIVCLCMFIL